MKIPTVIMFGSYCVVVRDISDNVVELCYKYVVVLALTWVFYGCL